ncbi:Eaf protein [Salmonella enterica]|nr:Eaf protein [Salmonella enterica]ECZ8525078.1 Eaf protein [Salmonella enterica]EFS3603927.1 Eaf protein [Salmonella enterica]EHA3028963.1 Eaf protein [Salmonella enterica]ELG0188399.1 Eaf protein [Salmonella enterica]
MINIDKLNDHELVDLKKDIERELKRRADGPKVTTYYVVSCITDAQHFTDMDCALRCLKRVTEDLMEWVAESPENRDYVNRCTGIVWAKLQVEEMNLDHFDMCVAEKYFDDIYYPPETAK